GRLQASQRADRALAWAIGGLDGFDKQMVGVGFTFVVPGCLPDIHWPLHIAVYTGAVNINCVYFSHYYRSFKTRTHKKRLGEDFPEMVQKSVEVGLVTSRCRIPQRLPAQSVRWRACCESSPGQQ